MREIAKLCRALGDESRLRILSLLLRVPGGVCVCELVDTLQLPQYQVSRQLGTLRSAGLVAAHKRGNWVYYGVLSDPSPVARAVLETLTAHLQTETAREDWKRLEGRLRMRIDGVCVIGYEPAQAFRKEVPASTGGNGTCEVSR